MRRRVNMAAEVRLNRYKRNRQRRVRTMKVLALFVLLAVAVLLVGIYTYITREATLVVSVGSNLQSDCGTSHERSAPASVVYPFLP